MIEQLGLNQTYFFHFAIFSLVFAVLKVTYFGPILELIALRRKKTVEAQEEAKKVELQNSDLLKKYQDALAVARSAARSIRDQILTAARGEESRVLNDARDASKKMTQEALVKVARQKLELEQALASEVEQISNRVTQKLLSEGGA